jgi:hypothetical protein
VSLIENLRDNINQMLGVRDSLGVAKKQVYIVTRTWSGLEPGDGTYKDQTEQVLPSPGIRIYSNDYRIKEGGLIQQGDVLLRWISRESFPYLCQVDGSVKAQNVEVFYKLDDILYRVIQVEEKLLCWHVQVRRVSKQ